MIFIIGGGCGLFAGAVRAQREDPLCRYLPGSEGAAAVGRDLRNKASGGQGLAASRGRNRAGPGRGPGAGRQTFRRYVEDVWLPNHEMEPTTRQRYTYCLYKHIMPEFGPMRMIDVLPEHVREWVTAQKVRGVSPAMIAENKVIL